jgi:hypothetical protein
MAAATAAEAAGFDTAVNSSWQRKQQQQQQQQGLILQSTAAGNCK